MIPLLHPWWKHVIVEGTEAQLKLSFDLHLLAIVTSTALEIHTRNNAKPSIRIPLNNVQFGWLQDLQGQSVLIFTASNEHQQFETSLQHDFRIIDLSLLIQVETSKLVFAGDDVSSMYALLGANDLARLEFNTSSELQVKHYWKIAWLEGESSFCISQHVMYSLLSNGAERHICQRLLQRDVNDTVCTKFASLPIDVDSMQTLDGLRFDLYSQQGHIVFENGKLFPQSRKSNDTAVLRVWNQQIIFYSESVGQALCESTREFAQELCFANAWENADLHRLEFALEHNDATLGKRAIDSLIAQHTFPVSTLGTIHRFAMQIASNNKLCVAVERFLARGIATSASQDGFTTCLVKLRRLRCRNTPAAPSQAFTIDVDELVRRSIPKHLWNKWSLIESNELVAVEAIEYSQHIGAVCTFLQARNVQHEKDVFEFVLECVKRRAYHHLVMFDFVGAQQCLQSVGIHIARFLESVCKQTPNRTLRTRLARHLSMCVHVPQQDSQFLLDMEHFYPGKSHILALRRSWANVDTLRQQHVVLLGSGNNRHNSMLELLCEAPLSDDRDGEFGDSPVGASSSTLRSTCLCMEDEEDEDVAIKPVVGDAFQGFFQLSHVVAERSDLETQWRVKAQAGAYSAAEDFLTSGNPEWVLQYLVDYNDWRGVAAWRNLYGDKDLERFHSIIASSSSPFIRDMFTSSLAKNHQYDLALLQQHGLVDCQDLLFPNTLPSVAQLVLEQLQCESVDEAKPKLGLKPYLALVALSKQAFKREDLLSFPLLLAVAEQQDFAQDVVAEEAELDESIIISLASNLFGMKPTAGETPQVCSNPNLILDAEYYVKQYRPHAAALQLQSENALLLRRLCLENPHDWRLVQTCVQVLHILKLPSEALVVDMQLLSLLLTHVPPEEEHAVADYFYDTNVHARSIVSLYSKYPAIDNGALLKRFCELHRLTTPTICQLLSDPEEWRTLVQSMQPNRIAQALAFEQCDYALVWKMWLVARCKLSSTTVASATLFDVLSECFTCNNEDCIDALERSANAFQHEFPTLCEFIRFLLAVECNSEAAAAVDFTDMDEDVCAFALNEMCRAWDKVNSPVLLQAILNLVSVMHHSKFTETLMQQRRYSLAFAVAQSQSLELVVIHAVESEARSHGLQHVPQSICTHLFANPVNSKELALAIQCAIKSKSKRYCKQVYKEACGLMMEWPFPEILNTLLLSGDNVPMEMIQLILSRCVTEDRYAQVVDWAETNKSELPSKIKQRIFTCACELYPQPDDSKALAQALGVEIVT